MLCFDCVCTTRLTEGAPLQDVQEGKQTLLQGHAAPITSVCTLPSRALVITADQGPESRLIAWDTTATRPAFKVEQPHAHGVLCTDLSADGSRLVTISQPAARGEPQEITLWEVADGAQPPRRLITVPVPAGDPQARLRRPPPQRCCCKVRLIAEGCRRNCHD
jgi:WD40 repeat protein